MDVYLPIAGLSVSAPLLAGLGAVVGFMSGLFGVGGGFLMTPALVWAGVPPTVAVASQASQVTAASVSSVLTYRRRGGVDVRMGALMAVGGALGVTAGVELLAMLLRLGQAELAIALSYLVLLSVVGALMMAESLQALLRGRRGQPAPRPRDRRPVWLYGLPFKMRFPRSRLYISALPPLGLGVFAGLLSAIMGVGGGFVLTPALVYLLRMPAGMVVGTSLVPIIFTTALATVLQAGRNQTVDVVLAGLLMVGGVMGAQLGARASLRFRAEALRAVLALIVLACGLGMGLSLLLPPEDLFAFAEGPGG